MIFQHEHIHMRYNIVILIYIYILYITSTDNYSDATCTANSSPARRTPSVLSSIAIFYGSHVNSQQITSGLIFRFGSSALIGSAGS